MKNPVEETKMPKMKVQERVKACAWADRLAYTGIALEEPGYHVWCCSPIIGPEGETHLFVSRWPVAVGFDPGWYTDCEIARYVGEKPEGPFTFKEVVLKGTGATTATWDRLAPHNPTIHKVGAQYVLLYIANSGENFPASQNIGMVVSKSLDGPWKKLGEDGLILSPPPDVWSFNSIVGLNNPALFQHPDGRFFLYYKARRAGDVRRMGVAIAESLEGPYVHHPTPLTNNPDNIEDAYAFSENGKIYLLTTDLAQGIGLLWASDDGINFGEPTLGFDRMARYIDPAEVEAATCFRGKKFERPQLLIQNGVPTHLFVAGAANIRRGDGSCPYLFQVITPK